jgi:hypothetical protein
MGDFLAFRRMVTPWLVRVVYVIGAVTLTAMGIALIVTPNQNGHGGSVAIGLVIGTFGNLIWRVMCEGIIVLFGIYETVAGDRHWQPGKASFTRPAGQKRIEGWVCAECE